MSILNEFSVYDDDGLSALQLMEELAKGVKEEIDPILLEESARKLQEGSRQLQESERQLQETSRKENETERENQEELRQLQEVNRVTSEETRSQFYNGFSAQLADIEQNQGLLSGLLTTAKTSIVAAINELFNSKANKAQEDWITPTLYNGWTTNPVSPVRYFKDSLGIVHLSGIITTGNNSLSALQLPAGYRPQYPQAFAVSANNAFGKCTIDTTGQVFISPGAVTTVYLSGISFKAV